LNTLRAWSRSLPGSAAAFISKITNTDVTPPEATASGYFYATAPNTVRLTFTEDVAASLSEADLILIGVPSGTPVNVTGYNYDSEHRHVRSVLTVG
jgi:hypothetical protein